ncbi:MAG: hypothetical protein PHR45_05715 [Muribaculaceae bacterium]|nr:hypothetical protein [Muribaculaceae bacterium]
MNSNSFNWISAPFVENLTKELIKLCTQKGFLNNQFYNIDELNACWHKSAPQYMADAVPEIPHYPTVAIAWATFYGLAAGSLWDSCWETVKEKDDLYLYLRNARGFDCLDDYVIEDILKLLPENHTRAKELTSLIQDCAEIALNLIRKEGIEPQSIEAFHMYAKTTETMFKLGVSLSLFSLGYKYEKLNLDLN